ncbi:MAG: ABC transporter permease [Archaeoglobaceae archaeon]|nr:ABC transporter permease [Archaeoglobaceae archaeon]MDW8128367.1 ABC transporter permease [Archaeoglobaceae archaeon]
MAIKTVLVKELKILVRDRRLFAIIIFQPILLTLVFGYAFSGEIKNVRIAVVDDSNSEISNALISALNYGESFDIEHFLATKSEGLELIKRGYVDAMLVIPKSFEGDLAKGRAKIEVYTDESKSSVSVAVINEIRTIAHSFSTKNFGGIEVEQNFVFSTKTRLIDFVAPALIGVVTLMIGLILSASSLAREKEEQTLELSLKALKSRDIVLGKFFAITAIVTFDTLIVMFLTHTLFGIEIRGSVLLLVMAQFLFLAGSIGIGLTISAFSATQLQGIQGAMLVGLISIFLSGFFYPLESMPEGARIVAFFIPLTYANTAFREIMIKGSGIEIVYPQLGVLTLYTILSLLISTKVLRKVVGGGIR